MELPIEHIQKGDVVISRVIPINELGISLIEEIDMPHIDGELVGVSIRVIGPKEKYTDGKLIEDGNSIKTTRFYSKAVQLSDSDASTLTNEEIEQWVIDNFTQDYQAAFSSYVASEFNKENIISSKAVFEGTIPLGHSLMILRPSRFGIPEIKSNCFSTDFYPLVELEITDPETLYKEDYLCLVSYTKSTTDQAFKIYFD